MIPDQEYKVKDDHEFHGGKYGTFEFMLGTKVVLRTDYNTLICVGPEDIEHGEAGILTTCS